MRTSKRLFAAGLVLASVLACKVSGRSSDSAAAMAAGNEVVGTYFAADSGHNLGKDWCYSGALVLDSTKHFGSVIKMCSDEGGGPVTESIKGTYHLRARSIKENGVRVPRLYVVLDQEGSRRKTHTLRYENGTLRFDEPWWMGAGLRALDIPDPVLKRVSASTSTDSATIASASSTPSTAKTSATKPAATR